MSSVAAASTMPVTSAVAQANIRKSFRILIIAAPCGHGTSVSTADMARAVVGNDGDAPIQRCEEKSMFRFGGRHCCIQLTGEAASVPCG